MYTIILIYTILYVHVRCDVTPGRLTDGFHAPICANLIGLWISLTATHTFPKHTTTSTAQPRLLLTQIVAVPISPRSWPT